MNEKFKVRKFCRLISLLVQFSRQFSLYFIVRPGSFRSFPTVSHLFLVYCTVFQPCRVLPHTVLTCFNLSNFLISTIHIHFAFSTSFLTCSNIISLVSKIIYSHFTLSAIFLNFYTREMPPCDSFPVPDLICRFSSSTL